MRSEFNRVVPEVIVDLQAPLPINPIGNLNGREVIEAPETTRIDHLRQKIICVGLVGLAVSLCGSLFIAYGYAQGDDNKKLAGYVVTGFGGVIALSSLIISCCPRRILQNCIS